jgi:flagellar assembly factor FliW
MSAAGLDVSSGVVRVRSRFADADIDPSDIVRFPDGIPGYETARDFVLLDVPDQAPLKMLHAVNAPEPCFLVVDPKTVLPTYRYVLSAADRRRLGAGDDVSEAAGADGVESGRSALLWLAIVSVDETGTVAVNLRAPIVINPERMTGRQVMPSACVYPLRHVIGQ